mmetsp:Transcript_14804/g.27913  ORF Transcript_14804/g.27913 Transcript_14804/m.27913 type:complete len:488 (-) Transcript_14804:157-1620(-)
MGRAPRVYGRYQDLGDPQRHSLLELHIAEGEEPEPKEIIINGKKFFARVMPRSKRVRIVYNGEILSKGAYSSDVLASCPKILCRNVAIGVRPEHIQAFFHGCGECTLINQVNRRSKEGINVSDTYIVGFRDGSSIIRALKRHGGFKRRTLHMSWMDEQLNTSIPGGIRAQVEYYFSDGNLLRDVHLNSLIMKGGPRGWVALEELMTWNKMKMWLMTEGKNGSSSTEMQIVSKALQNSSILELDDTGMFVRRRGPDNGSRYAVIVSNMWYKTNFTDFAEEIQHVDGIGKVEGPYSMSRFNGKAVILIESRESAEKMAEHFFFKWRDKRRLHAFTIRAFDNITACADLHGIRYFFAFPASRSQTESASWFSYCWQSVMNLLVAIIECLRQWYRNLPSIPSREWIFERGISSFWSSGGDCEDGEGAGGGAGIDEPHGVKTHGSVNGPPDQSSCERRIVNCDSLESDATNVVNSTHSPGNSGKGWFAELWE